MFSIRTILHPTDFSEPSTAALQTACDLAQSYRARLIVLHVVAPPLAFYTEYSVPPDPAEIKAEDQARLDRLSLPINVGCERWLKEGDPATEIVRVAQEVEADVIVMGTHGRTGLERLFLGSVAEHVVRSAPCPVLTVKAMLPRAVQSKEAIPVGASASS
jgi:nucleotide-binding universal stress UspA family protein